MLNTNLKLNENLFNETVEQKAVRDGFGQALVELGEKNPDVVVLTADLSESTRVEGFCREISGKIFEVGVAEQNMVAIAAGLAVSGKIPFASSYSVFSPGKNLETIRTTIAYNRANVKLAGHHSGILTRSGRRHPSGNRRFSPDANTPWNDHFSPLRRLSKPKR